MPRYLLFPLALLALWLELVAGGGFTKNGGPQDGDGGPGAEQATTHGDDGPFGDPHG